MKARLAVFDPARAGQFERLSVLSEDVIRGVVGSHVLDATGIDGACQGYPGGVHPGETYAQAVLR
ncbi:hypothetical protein GCM10009661_73330 [Catellatospora chokoriensis]|uniref:Uncharacterized protein n=1 Tax=Catellatospora chokoriensis TaxID=310353 RepID=A0A8J3K046_9ACTN|nr:hypothetical protein Cch02nite_17340 [Catellatospora chokoriensis]